MRCWWQIFVFWVFWMLILWLVAPRLDLTPEPAPQEDLMYLGLNSESKLRKVWKLLLTVIPRPSGSHFDLYCKTCVVMGSSQILWGTGHSINQYTKVFRMNQAPVQDFETDVSNRTTGCFIYPKNAGDQGDRSWLVLLLLKLSNLAWTLDIQNFRRLQFPSGVEDHKGKVTLFGFGSEEQGKRSHYWNDEHQTNGSRAILSMHSVEAGMEAVHQLKCEGKLTVHTSTTTPSPLGLNARGSRNGSSSSSSTMRAFRGEGQEETVWRSVWY